MHQKKGGFLYIMNNFDEEMEDFGVDVELTPQNYLTFTTDCANKVKDTSSNILGLTAEFDDKNRIIKASKEQIIALKQAIAMAKLEKKEIKKELKIQKRSLKVDINFLNKLNRSMAQPYRGAHLVEYQKRKIK